MLGLMWNKGFVPDYSLCWLIICSVNLQSQVMCLTAHWTVSSPSPSCSKTLFLSNSSSFFGCWGTSVLSYKKHSRWKTDHVLWIFYLFFDLSKNLPSGCAEGGKCHLLEMVLNVERNPVFLIWFFFLSHRFFSPESIMKGFLENSFSWD